MRSVISTRSAMLAILMLGIAFLSNPNVLAQDPEPTPISVADCPPCPPQPPPPPVIPLIIDEYRLRGPGLTAGTNSATDEYVEIYNNSDAPVTVSVTDGSDGYALVASDGLARFVIPIGTVIPARGHYLGVNSAGYSLGGPGGCADGDITYTLDIPDGSGIALFNTANPVGFTIANRLDAVGYNVPNPLYREGTGFNPTAVNEGTAILQYCFYRDLRSGLPLDTNNNATDFLGVETFAFTTSASKLLGSPGPKNLNSPIQRNATINASLIDPAQASSSAPNRVRDATPLRYLDPTTGVQIIFPLGTLSVRRYFTNNTGQPVTRLRFRIVDITTGPTPTGTATADVRALSSGPVKVVLTDSSTITVQGTRLEQPPQLLRGGGWNQTLALDLSGPLAAGASIPVQFYLAVQQSGSFRFFINVEGLP